MVGADLHLMSGLASNEPLDAYGAFPDPTGYSTWTGFARIPGLLVMLVTGLFVLIWIYRASRNAHAFARGLKTPPPWAVAWFFIPIALLWKPFGAMSETWRVSSDPDNWTRRFPPDVMRWWWAFWLISNIAGNANFRVGMMARDVGGLRWSVGLEGATALASVGAGLCLIWIIRRVSANQTRLIAEGRQRPENRPEQAWMDQGSEPF